MKLTILGRSGPFSEMNGACSSYLIQSAGKNIVLDMGNGSLAILQRYIKLTDIDVVVLSHLHHDHVSDLHLLKYALKDNDKGARPLLLLPPSPKRMFDLLVDGDIFDIDILSDGMSIDVGDNKLSFCMVSHPTETMAISVQCGSKRIVYSGDSNSDASLEKFAFGADIFLVDGGLSNKRWHSGSAHMSTGLACEAGKLAQAKRVIITHISPLDPEEEIESQLEGGAELARLGAIYDI